MVESLLKPAKVCFSEFFFNIMQSICVKFLRRELQGSAKLLHRFLLECRAVNRRNVVGIVSYSATDLWRSRRAVKALKSCKAKFVMDECAGNNYYFVSIEL